MCTNKKVVIYIYSYRIEHSLDKYVLHNYKHEENYMIIMNISTAVDMHRKALESVLSNTFSLYLQKKRIFILIDYLRLLTFKLDYTRNIFLTFGIFYYWRYSEYLRITFTPTISLLALIDIAGLSSNLFRVSIFPYIFISRNSCD